MLVKRLESIINKEVKTLLTVYKVTLQTCDKKKSLYTEPNRQSVDFNRNLQIKPRVYKHFNPIFLSQRFVNVCKVTELQSFSADFCPCYKITNFSDGITSDAGKRKTLRLRGKICNVQKNSCRLQKKTCRLRKKFCRLRILLK